MRILVLGAGAIGGYFGGRLLQAKRDVTFLVRPARAARLAETGLVIKSPFGDATLPAPPTTVSGAYDLVLLSCKAYDLESAMEGIAPAVGPRTTILPLLNGMRHLDALDQRFGKERVLGGLAIAALTLDDAGRILHLNQNQTLTFGERDGSRSPRVLAIETALSGATFEAKLSEQIVLEMWEKWVLLATLAAETCLMRASVGDIVAAGGAPFATAMLAESIAIATASGYPPRDPVRERVRGTISAEGSTLTASMLRDVERGSRTEADHILGDLIRRGTGDSALLSLAYLHLRAYEVRRARGS
ncbi:MAG TPA: 2-dehydropantoate 2-reductase [Gemmatimonadaceae bacterium]|nr:2-dehydropantoate 2-reductase [Gemmatimonadaceae bacterium]